MEKLRVYIGSSRLSYLYDMFYCVFMIIRCLCWLQTSNTAEIQLYRRRTSYTTKTLSIHINKTERLCTYTIYM